jgi:hypothetical protein
MIGTRMVLSLNTRGSDRTWNDALAGGGVQLGLMGVGSPRVRLDEPLPTSSNSGMSRLALGMICGLIFAAVDVALMLPMSFPDKWTALLAAFFSRFGIGLVIPLVQLPSWPGWLIGLAFGLLLSLPDAIVTKAYAPILLSGAIGGLIIGGLTHGWGTSA